MRENYGENKVSAENQGEYGSEIPPGGEGSIYYAYISPASALMQLSVRFPLRLALRSVCGWLLILSQDKEITILKDLYPSRHLTMKLLIS